MKRLVIGASTGLVVVMLIISPLRCFASDGIEALEQAAESISYPAGMDGLASGTDVLNTSPAAWVTILWNALKSEIRAPVMFLGTMLTISVLSVLLGGLTETVGGGLKRLCDLLCVLVCAGAAANPLCQSIERTAEVMQEGSVFMAGFVPVFGGFLSAGGAVTGGASYQVMMLFLIEWMQQINVNWLFPILRAGAALSMADAVNPTLRLGGLVNGMRKGVTLVLRFIMTAFAAILSIRSFVSSAADGLGAKTVRLLTSTLIPIVGSAVSDAYGTVQGSIRILQNGTGVLGMIAIAWITVPPMLSVLCYRAAFGITAIAADLTGAEAVRRLCSDAEAVLAAAFALLVSFAVMLMLSSALMLTLLSGKT